MDAIELSQLLSREINPPIDVANEYDPHILPSIIRHWDELNCATNIEDPDLISSYIRFRLNLGHFHPQQLPQELGDHVIFMRFLRGCYELYLSNVSVMINVSPTLLLFDMTTNTYNLLYASQNFFLWETAKQINNEESKNLFFSDLSNLNLHDELLKSVNALSEKYESMQLSLVSLMFRYVFFSYIWFYMVPFCNFISAASIISEAPSSAL